MWGHGVRWGRGAFLLAVVVTGLLLGLVGMHHLSVAPHSGASLPGAPHSAASLPGTSPPDAHGGPAAAASHPAAAPLDGPVPPDDDGGHGSEVLHLCLAVLTALAILVVSTAVWWLPRPLTAARRVGVSRRWTAPRAPPPTAPARLALLCVLRT